MARRKRLVAVAATLTMLLIAFGPLVSALPVLTKDNEPTVWQGQEEETPQYQEGTGTYLDIYLYFHKTTSEGGQNILNTEGGSNGVDVIPNANSVLFQLEVPLTKNLKVLGHEIDATRKGFWMDLSVSAYPAASVTVEVLDGEAVVANDTKDLTGSESRWNLPFSNGLDSYTFMKGNKIGVRITTTGSTTVNYQTNDKLWVLCDPVSLSGDTYNANGVRTKTFQPNDIEDNRHVVIRGKINDAWGAGDVANVFIDIRDPGGTSIVNATATLDGLNFTYDWNYSSGQQAGTYSALVTMYDQQDNGYGIDIAFTMATYGVHLSSPQAEDGIVIGSVERGECVSYTLTVLNTGAAATSYTVSQSSSDVSGWSVSITPSQTGTIQPGESKVVNVEVCADDDVEESTQAVFYIQAVASGDPTAKDSIQIITTAVPKINLTLRWTTQGNSCNNLVNTGGSVACSFEIKNSGAQSLNISFTMEMTKGSPDWTASVSPSSIVSGSMIMHPEQIISGTLNITAPDDPSKTNESLVTLRARASDIDPPLSKSISATTIMSTGINLEVVGPSSVDIDSDDHAEFAILVSNTDPNNDHTIVLNVVPPSGWNVEYVASSKTFMINAQDSKDVRLKVTPSNNAPAGNYDIEVTGSYQDNPQTWDRVDLSVKIKEKHELKLTVTPTKKEVGGDETAVFTVKVENLGNVDERSAKLKVIEGDGDLSATIEIDGNRTISKSTTIPRGQTMTYTVEIEPKDEAVHKDKRWYRIEIQGVKDTDSTEVKVTVTKDTDELMNDLFTDYQTWILIALVIVVLAFYKGVSSRKKK